MKQRGTQDVRGGIFLATKYHFVRNFIGYDQCTGWKKRDAHRIFDGKHSESDTRYMIYNRYIYIYIYISDVAGYERKKLIYDR
jgi:hypothetical protein